MVKGLYTAYTGMRNEMRRMDILANNLFNAGRTVNLDEADLNAVWCEAYAQAVTLMAFHNSDYKILKKHRRER